MPSYSITPITCNELHLRFGRVVEPIFIEDVPSPMTEETIHERVEFQIGTAILIVEDVETHVETPVETHIRNCNTRTGSK